MFKTLLLSAGLGAYHFLNVLLFQIPQEVIVPTWVEKLSVISILAIVIYYLYKENEKQKTLYAEITLRHEQKFDSFQERLFVIEKDSITAIRDFQGVMQQIATTLYDMKVDIKELTQKNVN